SFSSLPVLLRPPRPTLCPYTTMIEATARTRAAWIVQPVFSGLSVRDRANARDRRTNRPAPRATRIATVWRYGEARNPWAAGEPSPTGARGGPASNPVARANRPT